MYEHQEANEKVSKIFDRSDILYVKNVTRKGRGVFANAPFAAGDVIERAPTWGFDDAEAVLLDRTGLFQYYFVRHDRQLTNDSMAGYVIFGFISVVNHSWMPNAKIFWSDEDSGAWVTLVAVNDIKIDEEITHRYTNISSYPHYIKFI
ncbi:SET domain-containing protein-lysine N-methyltransferase [Mesorhizobium sp. M0306]|uniref:SET domain-containing protein-lysine N-methyltransferase n=1 Tax=Mesorhizobium sp. M0306 TaxID=2956932 RepID=UPI003338AEF3